MAQRRMTSLDVIDTDAFLDMPQSSQLLYFHLNARADDDGFVSNPKRIMRDIGSQADDFKLLAAKKFIIIFEDGVCVIKHWRINNFIRKDVYKETKYLDLKKTLFIRSNGAYTLTSDERAIPIPKGHFTLESVNESLTERQPSIGKDSIGKDSIGNDFSDEKSSVYEEIEKQTYKSKYAIAKQKGIRLKRLPKTDKKRIAEDALNSVSYFREKAMEIHGFKYSEENKQRNAVVLKNAKMIVEKIGLDKTKELIDWFLYEDNIWCNYKPEVCFRMTTLEDFDNKDIKPKSKKEVLQEVGNMRFYSKEEIDKAEKDGRIKWDWKREKWIANNLK
jgi:hypothetical protein